MILAIILGLTIITSGTKQGCKKNQWSCLDKKCIKISEVCNGVINCKDGSDELCTNTISTKTSTITLTTTTTSTITLTTTSSFSSPQVYNRSTISSYTNTKTSTISQIPYTQHSLKKKSSKNVIIVLTIIICLLLFTIIGIIKRKNNRYLLNTTPLNLHNKNDYDPEYLEPVAANPVYSIIDN